jgi:peptide deformylase
MKENKSDSGKKNSDYSIKFYGSPILRLTSKKVKNFGGYLKPFIQKMYRILTLYKGIGLSSNQIGSLKRIILIDFNFKNKNKNLFQNRNSNNKLDFPLILINPEIIFFSNSKEVQTEGCLSFPNLYLKISRPKKINLKFKNIMGEENFLYCSGILSRCVQHEIDHLNGILMIDRYIIP